MKIRKKNLEGHFAEARAWLLEFADNNQLKNETLLTPLEADWSTYSKARAAYVLGVIWGRLRQMKSSLEQATEYANIVQAELDDETGDRHAES
jgi:hypothetical protein